MNIGRAVRVTRAFKGLSQQQLAECAGFDASYISLVESNRRRPRPETLEKLAEAMGVPSELLRLLGATGSELRGISADQAREFGLQLLRMLEEQDTLPLFKDET